MDAPPLRWGVLGTGWIAERFAAALRAGTRQQVYAVGSRSRATAERFAAAAGAPSAYGSYEQLVADPAVDVVYVATPHPLHHAHARMALLAGKHVVVEKPMCLSGGGVRDLGVLAEGHGLFLMEALWTLFLPKFDVVRQVLEQGLLGDARAVLADMGEHFEPDHRIWRGRDRVAAAPGRRHHHDHGRHGWRSADSWASPTPRSGESGPRGQTDVDGRGSNPAAR